MPNVRKQPRRARPRPRRHELEVTVDRLRDHYAKYHERLTGKERDEISHVAYVLEQLAEGTDA